ncbi:hypothetical protein JHK85_040415 [Glycine max]|nr:hypothetical protein JHK85_040415 [Glycine max]
MASPQSVTASSLQTSPALQVAATVLVPTVNSVGSMLGGKTTNSARLSSDITNLQVAAAAPAPIVDNEGSTPRGMTTNSERRSSDIGGYTLLLGDNQLAGMRTPVGRHSPLPERGKRFDIKWTAPIAEGSFNDARGDIIISHDYITVNSASAAFDLYMRVQTSYPDDFHHKTKDYNIARAIPFTIDGVELDLRMRGFEFFSLVSAYAMDSLRPLLLKASGRIKFQGKVLKPNGIISEQNFEMTRQHVQMLEKGIADSLFGEVSISGLKLNQLMLAPQLSGLLRLSPGRIKLDASGRTDESLAVEFVGPLQPCNEDGLQSGKLLSISLKKGQLRANICFQPFHSANLEVRHFPLDELELASLRGTVQRKCGEQRVSGAQASDINNIPLVTAEIQLNLQKRRGHGVLSVLKPKFSGVLGEALDVAARWSGDVVSA